MTVALHGETKHAELSFFVGMFGSLVVDQAWRMVS